MKQIQLYIEDQRVELFKDESIVLTQTVQNVKDVGKVFTPFSRSFTCPASKINNKIFKHFYNFSIVDAIDPRRRMDARIDLNHSRFEKGKVKLEGVQMKDNRPSAYKITFFGNTVTLKDKLRNDKLDALAWLRNFSFTYSSDNLINTLQNGQDITVDDVVYENAFVVPLITHEDRLFYESASPGLNNLAYGSTYGGVNWQQLKPAIRLDIIIKAIEDQYDIKFSDDFFSDTNPAYYDLYMWMHRKKGNITEAVSGVDLYTQKVVFDNQAWGESIGLSRSFGGFATYWGGYQINNIVSTPNGSYTHDDSLDYFGNYDNIPSNVRYYNILHTVRPQSQSTPYNIVVKRNGQVVRSYEDVEGNKNFQIDFYENGNVEIEFQSTESMTFDETEIRVAAYEWYGYLKVETFESDPTIISPNFSFDSTREIPEITVIDFLSGLFKLFNLVAFVDYEGTVVVKTLDSWFNESDNTFDITKYIDSTQSTIDIALPYREILFDYEGKKSFFAANHNALFNYEHGVERYRGEDDELLAGQDYRIKVPFEHHKFERLINVTDGAKTDIQWGWSVDDNMQSILGKPLLFYPIRQEASIAVRSTTSTHTETQHIHIPSNSRSLDPNVSTENINFKAEMNEFTATVFEDTLFKKYYKEYISDTFSPSRRLSKFTAKLPMSFLLNYELNDQVIVFDRIYRINEIQTNLATGISKIELINIEENTIAITRNDVLFTNIDSNDGDASENFVTIDLTELTNNFYP